MTSIISTTGTGTTLDEAMEACTAFRYSLDEHQPLTQAQAARIDRTINAGPRCRDVVILIAIDPAIKDKDIAAYIDGTDTTPADAAFSRALRSPARTIPAGRAGRAVKLLDDVAAVNPDTSTNVLAAQATLLWLDGQNQQAQQKAGQAIQEDPWNRLARIMQLETALGASPRWNR